MLREGIEKPNFQPRSITVYLADRRIYNKRQKPLRMLAFFRVGVGGGELTELNFPQQTTKE